jgi:ABC-2 type transport system ATP-binding protein
VLAVRGVVVERGGRRTLDNVDLEVPEGSVFALLGGNGAGKTTLLEVLLGFVRCDAGTATVDGIPVSDTVAVRRLIAYVPENVALYPYLSGRENLIYFAAIAGHGLSRTETTAHLSLAGLSAEAHDRRVAGYSKGMRQKVGLAIAQARGARAMLFDEPTSGLDPEASADLAFRLRAARDAGAAVLMATHDLHNALQTADQIGILQQGRLVATFDATGVNLLELERVYLGHAMQGRTP